MNKQCEIVRDLLPLYVDKACSASSAQLVEEHLAECNECAGIFEDMKSSRYDMELSIQKEEVLTHHAKVQKRKTFMVGAVIAGILCIPILVCLIVNLAVGHALDWFFIVATSLMVFASITVVPLMAEKNRGLWTLLCFTVSLMLLLLTCAIYTGGSWFAVASSSVLFGLSVVFTPYATYALPMTGFWGRNKALFSLCVDTVLLGVMLITIGLRSSGLRYWVVMPQITLVCVGFVWLLFLLCRYLRANKLIRCGIASILVGIYTFVIDSVIGAILGASRSLPQINLGEWSISSVSGNVKWIIFVALSVFGIVCIVIGKVRSGKK